MSEDVATGLPHALTFPIDPCAANEPWQLYDGPFEVTQKSVTVAVNGQFQLEWFPFPRFAFHVRQDMPTHQFSLDDPASIRLPDGTLINEASISQFRYSWPPTGTSEFSGSLHARVIRSQEADVNYVMFAIVNMASGRGAGIDFPDGAACAGRRVLLACGWKITIDRARHGSDQHEFLKSNSGFAVTHVGRLEREDAAFFSATKSFEILSALARFLSFCEGRWCAIALPHGFLTDGSLRWTAWSCDRVVPYKFRQSWTDNATLNQLEESFPGFLGRWSDECWKDVVSNAIHWLVEANASAGSIEGAIILTQTAFELLASAILVENHNWVSPDGFEKLQAADRLRLLFVWAGIPTEIPPPLTDLQAVAKADNCDDAPSVMTAIRNTITHPTKKNRDRYNRHSTDARRDAWSLGLWYLELCLLRLFGYSGQYANRLTQKWSGQVEDVPWKK